MVWLYAIAVHGSKTVQEREEVLQGCSKPRVREPHRCAWASVTSSASCPPRKERRYLFADEIERDARDEMPLMRKKIRKVRRRAVLLDQSMTVS